jgi:hypothetical protein
MRLRGYTYQDIAAVMGVTHSTIIEGLQRFAAVLDAAGDPQVLDAYKDHRSNLLSAAEMTLLTDLADSGRRQKASLNNVAYALGQVANLRRLEEGKTTENVGHAGEIVARLEALSDDGVDVPEALFTE